MFVPHLYVIAMSRQIQHAVTWRAGNRWLHLRLPSSTAFVNRKTAVYQEIRFV